MGKNISFSFKNLLEIFIIIFVLALIAAASDYLASKYKKQEVVPTPAVKAINQQEIEGALSLEVPAAERPAPLSKEEIQKALNKKIE